MANECRKAGHRGDYEANHVFDDAVGRGLVSMGAEGKRSAQKGYVLQLAQDHDDYGLIRLLGFRDLVA